MGVTTDQLPDSSEYFLFAYAVALEIVNRDIRVASCLMYTLAVYNLGGSNLINFAQDPNGAPPVANSKPQLPFFAYSRSQWKINSFVSGVIQSASDESTSESMVTQKAFENLTLADLQYLKDPYGRQYLSIAQRYGSLWGIT
jgi:hypothetical protein